MNDETLTLSDIAELVADCDVTPRMLRHWRAGGLLPAADAARGQGRHTKWSMAEGLGIVIGCRLFASRRGCSPQFLPLVVRGFARKSVDAWAKLLERTPAFATIIESGAAPPYTCNVVLGELLPDRIDARSALVDMTEKVSAMRQRLAGGGAPGRRRGLAAKAEK
jgi:hypothetical protein